MFPLYMLPKENQVLRVNLPFYVNFFLPVVIHLKFTNKKDLICRVASWPFYFIQNYTIWLICRNHYNNKNQLTKRSRCSWSSIVRFILILTLVSDNTEIEREYDRFFWFWDCIWLFVLGALFFLFFDIIKQPLKFVTKKASMRRLTTELLKSRDHQQMS